MGADFGANSVSLAPPGAGAPEMRREGEEMEEMETHRLILVRIEKRKRTRRGEQTF